ncbi:MAG: TonB-dependent receptor [bacterium]
MKLKSLIMGTTALACGLSAGSAIAQDDEIIITATKREQTLQEVPIAVTVVDGDTVDKAQIVDILDLQSVVPSLRVSQLQQSGNSSFIIRGFGNGSNNTGIEPSVAVFIDGVYRSRSASALSDMPDLERVEVLRGPQSTLFGKNASVGVISFVTKKPKFEPEGSLEATVGNYSQLILKGHVTGPVTDNLAFSLAASRNIRDGYATNIVDGSDLNNRNRSAIRGQLLFEPADDFSLRVIADYDTLDEICCYTPNITNGPTGAVITGLGGTIITNPFGYETALDVNPTNNIENTGISAQMDWNLEIGDLTSITSFRRQDAVSNGDVDFTSLDLIEQNLLSNDIDTFTQEIRLTGETANIDWLLGGYYFNEEVVSGGNVIYDDSFYDYANALTGGLLPSLENALGYSSRRFFAPGTGTAELFTQDNVSYSLFAQGDVHFSDRLTGTFGIAYINDEKDVTGTATNTDVFSGIDLVTDLSDPNVLRNLPLSAIPSIGASFDNIVLATAYGAVTNMAFDINDYIALLTLAGGGDPTAIATVNAINATIPVVEPLVAGQVGSGLAASFAPLQFLPPFLAFPNSIENGSTSDDKVTYTARLAYDLNDNINIYGSYATGYKASSWNLTRDSSYFAADQTALAGAGLIPNNRAPGTRYAGPEDAEVWEIGMKANFEDLAINLAVFDQTVEGFQSTIFQGTGFVLSNAGKQSTTGAEVDATWTPTDEWTITFAGTFLDPIYDDYQNAPGLNGPTDLSGTRPSGISETSLYLGAQYDHEFSNGVDGFVRADYQHESNVQLVENVPAISASREVNMINASAGISWEGYDFSIWGRNLTDDEFYQSGFPTVAQAGSFNGYPNQPKTYGATLRANF